MISNAQRAQHFYLVRPVIPHIRQIREYFAAEALNILSVSVTGLQSIITEIP